MPGTETPWKRYFRHRWGTGHAQPCLRPGCDNVLNINELCEGDIWACGKCMLKHEFYDEYVVGPGGSLRCPCVRLLDGDHVRDKGEPGILEFAHLEDVK